MTATTDASSIWKVYILECGDGSLYTGITLNLDERITTHNQGDGAKYTRSRLPVHLVYMEAASDRSSALQREAAIKKLSRPDKLHLIDSQSATATHSAG